MKGRIGYKWTAPILALGILMSVFAVVGTNVAGLTVTPNPTSATVGDTINVTADTTNMTGNLTFTVYNSTNASVATSTVTISENTTSYLLNTTNLTAGNYIVNATQNTTSAIATITLSAPTTNATTNTTSNVINVTGTPNIVVVSVTVDKTEYVVNEGVIISVKLNNTGNATGTGYMVAKIGNDVIMNRTVILAANETRYENTTWSAKEGTGLNVVATFNGTGQKESTAITVKAAAKGFLPGFDIAMLGVTFVGLVLIIGRRKK